MSISLFLVRIELHNLLISAQAQELWYCDVCMDILLQDQDFEIEPEIEIQAIWHSSLTLCTVESG